MILVTGVAVGGTKDGSKVFTAVDEYLKARNLARFSRSCSWVQDFCRKNPRDSGSASASRRCRCKCSSERWPAACIPA